MAIHFSFLKSCTKSYFHYSLTVPSAYFLRTFTVLLPLCSQKYRSDNILPIPLLILGCNILLFYHLSLLAGFHFKVRSICRHSPFLLAFIFFSVLVLIILILIRCGASTLVCLSQIRSKYNCNTVNVWLHAV